MTESLQRISKHTVMIKGNSFALLLPLIIIAIVGYSFPWVNAPGVSLQPNGYDLAEWLTLHPFVRATSRMLLPALAIRLNLLWIGILLMLYRPATRSNWLTLLRWLLFFGIWVAQIPPVNFFRGQYNDTNYLQQFWLWVAFLIAGIGVNWVSTHTRIWIGVIVSIAGIFCSGWGLMRGYQLLKIYEIPVQLGYGGILLLLTFASTLSLHVRYLQIQQADK